MRPDALMRDLRSRTGRKTMSIKRQAVYKLLVCEMRETRSVGQSGASMRSIQKHGLCVRSSELANMHYKLI